MRLLAKLAAGCLGVLASATGLLADDGKLALENLKTSQDFFEHNHFVAGVSLEVERDRFVEFRYERFRLTETIAKRGGVSYERRSGGDWQKADEWDRKYNPEFSAGELEELNNIVSLVYSPFAKPEPRDMSQGGTVWKFVSKRMDKDAEYLTYEGTREHPRPDGVYPRCTFAKGEDESDGHLILCSYQAQFFLGQKLVPVKVDYLRDRPEDWLRSAKEINDRVPCKVDALVTGQRSFRVRGIISGGDFDLSIQTLGEGDFRQIKSGTSFWKSSDAGKTWAASGAYDPTYYRLVHSPINFIKNERIPPFKASPATESSSDRQVRHIQFVSPEPVRSDRDRPNYWLSMDGQTPTGILRFSGPQVLDKSWVGEEVEYTLLSTSTRVLPPPGNPEAVPAKGPEDLLLDAQKAMQRHGPISVSATTKYTKTARITGTIIRDDFDLTQTPEDPASKPLHTVAIGNKAWGSFDGGKTWKKERADDRLLYHLVYVPVYPGRLHPGFETIGSEKHGESTWVHIAAKVPGKISSETQRPHYWIEVDQEGRALGVRRYEGSVVSTGVLIECKADYELLPPATKLHPPSHAK